MKARPIRIEGDVAYVPLSRGLEAAIDAADAPLVAGRNWYAWVSGRGDGLTYAMTDIGGGSTRVRLRMHRVIMACPVGLEVDHIDGRGLNNKRSNLRLASRAENARNIGLSASNKSGRKGVSWCSRTGKWLATISADGKTKFLGRFAEKDTAAAAYAAVAQELHGEFWREA